MREERASKDGKKQGKVGKEEKRYHCLSKEDEGGCEEKGERLKPRGEEK